MGKIDELIQQYCPEGVEYVSLSKVCQSIKTGKLNANAMVEGGQYPFFTCSDKVFTIDKYSFDTEALLVAGNGYLGNVNYYKGKFDAYQRTYVLSDFVKRADIMYVYYAMQNSFRDYALKSQKDGSVPYITIGIFDSYCIPLPPLPVQKEIVRILDNFTNLAAELQAELQARQQQYQYYRDTLLSFDGRDDVQWKKLGEVAKVCRGTRVVKSQLSNEGYPVYQNCLTPMGYFDKTNCPGGTPFVICGGAAGNVGYADVDCWAADDCEYIIAGEGICSRYIYHCLMVKKEYLTSKVRKASIPRLSPSVIKELEIPIPPLSEQQHIVNILDRFDTLTNDLSQGLPAEIEARQQQYEYYRDQLLTFKRKEA